MSCWDRFSGREPQAASLGAQFADALRELDTTALALPRERVLYLIWKKPWMTVARGTYIAATARPSGMGHGRRGRERTGAAARYPQLAGDDPLWRAADRILVSSEPYAFRDRDAREIEAAYGKPAHLIDGEMTSWYGPRAIAGMRYLARIRAGWQRRRDVKAECAPDGNYRHDCFAMCCRKRQRSPTPGR
jgi:hypothetical protein